MATRTPFNRVGDTLPNPMATAPNFNAIVENAIPGFGGMSTGASNIVNQLIQGMPSAAPTQRANAYFGTQSGMPGSDFVRNRGFDLYGQEAEASKQRGFDNFLKMIGAFSGTVAPTTGQSLQSSQADADRLASATQADLSRKHSTAMQSSQEEARNYWDPRWRNRNSGMNPYRNAQQYVGRSTF